MAETTMVGAKPTWFLDRMWRGQRFEAYGHGYGIQVGKDDKPGTVQLFVQSLDDAGMPTPKSERISIDVLTTRDWDHDNSDGVAVVTPHEFANRLVVERHGALSAWDQAVQAVEIAMAAYDCAGEVAK